MRLCDSEVKAEEEESVAFSVLFDLLRLYEDDFSCCPMEKVLNAGMQVADDGEKESASTATEEGGTMEGAEGRGGRDDVGAPGQGTGARGTDAGSDLFFDSPFEGEGIGDGAQGASAATRESDRSKEDAGEGVGDGVGETISMILFGIDLLR